MNRIEGVEGIEGVGRWLMTQRDECLASLSSYYSALVQGCKINLSLRYFCDDQSTVIHIVFYDDKRVGVMKTGVVPGEIGGERMYFDVDHVLVWDDSKSEWLVKRPKSDAPPEKDVCDMMRELCAFCTMPGKWIVEIDCTLVRFKDWNWAGIGRFGYELASMLQRCTAAPSQTKSAFASLDSQFNIQWDDAFDYGVDVGLGRVETCFSFAPFTC